MKKTALTFLICVMVTLIATAGLAKPKPIVLGAPLSTAFAPGWVPEKGIKLAVEEINAAGGVDVGGKKRPFKVEVMDTRDNEPGVPVSDALLVVEKLILGKGADFLVGGPTRSEAALPTMDLVARYKKVHIITSGSISPGIAIKMEKNPEKYKYSFRITGDARWHARIAVGGLMGIKGKFGLNKIFFIVQDAAYARAGTKVLSKILTGKGWEVTGYEVYPMGSTDFSSGLLKAKAAGPGVLLAWMELPEGAILAKQWYDMKVPALLFGSPLEVGAHPEFWKTTNGKGEYITTIMTNVGNAPCEATPWTMKFVNAYRTKYGINPEGSFADVGYMGVYLLKDAIERAGTIKSDAVVKALEKTDMMGVFGRIRFNPKYHDLIFAEDPAEGAMIGHTQWQAGKMLVVYPPSISNGEIQLPPWMKK